MPPPKTRYYHGDDNASFIQNLVGGFANMLSNDSPTMAGQAVSMVGDLSRMAGTKTVGDALNRWGQQMIDWGESGDVYVPPIHDFRDVDSVADFTNFTGFLLGNGLGSLGVVAGSGGLGFAIQQAGRAGLKFAGKKAASQAARAGLPLMGAGAGAITSSFVLNAGETRQQLIDEGVDDETASLFAFPAGMMMAALDVAPIAGAYSYVSRRKAGKEAVKKVAGRLKNIGKLGGLGAAAEATTEGLQGVTRELAGNLAGGDKEFEDRLWDIATDFYAGGVTGGVVGGTLGLATYRDQDKIAQKQIDADKTAMAEQEMANELAKKMESEGSEFVDKVEDVKTSAEEAIKSGDTPLPLPPPPPTPDTPIIPELQRGDAAIGSLKSSKFLGSEWVYATGAEQPEKAGLAVVELSELIPNPSDYQQRTRTTGASDAQVRHIAANLVPRQLIDSDGTANTGSPVITPDGRVVSGSARTMALREVYKNGKAAPYIKDIEERLGTDFKHMKQPVMVRTLLQNDEAKRKAFSIAANQPKSATSEPEREAQEQELGILRLTQDRPLEENNLLTPDNDVDAKAAWMSTLPVEMIPRYFNTKVGTAEIDRITNSGKDAYENAYLMAGYGGDKTSQQTFQLFDSILGSAKSGQVFGALRRAMLDNAPAAAKLRTANNEEFKKFNASLIEVLSAVHTWRSKYKTNPFHPDFTVSDPEMYRNILDIFYEQAKNPKSEKEALKPRSIKSISQAMRQIYDSMLLADSSFLDGDKLDANAIVSNAADRAVAAEQGMPATQAKPVKGTTDLDRDIARPPTQSVKPAAAATTPAVVRYAPAPLPEPQKLLAWTKPTPASTASKPPKPVPETRRDSQPRLDIGVQSSSSSAPDPKTTIVAKDVKRQQQERNKRILKKPKPQARVKKKKPAPLIDEVEYRPQPRASAFPGTPSSPVVKLIEALSNELGLTTPIQLMTNIPNKKQIQDGLAALRAKNWADTANFLEEELGYIKNDIGAGNRGGQTITIDSDIGKQHILFLPKNLQGAEQFHALAHELGKIVSGDLKTALPKEFWERFQAQHLAIKQKAYNATLASFWAVYGAPTDTFLLDWKDNHEMTVGEFLALETDAAISNREFVETLLSEEALFAEQFAKFLFTDKKPVGIVERVFAELADKIKALVNIFKKSFGADMAEAMPSVQDIANELFRTAEERRTKWDTYYKDRATKQRLEDMKVDTAIDKMAPKSEPMSNLDNDDVAKLIAYAARRESVGIKELKSRMKQLGLIDNQDNLRVLYAITNNERGLLSETAQGAYRTSMRTILLKKGKGDNLLTLDHESIHAMRDMGLFTKKEWQQMVGTMLRNKRLKVAVDKAYPDISNNGRKEEMVAIGFSLWKARQEADKIKTKEFVDRAVKAGIEEDVISQIKPTTFMDKIYRRIDLFLDALRNLFAGHGFRSGESVFADIESGEIGSRPEGFGTRDVGYGQSSDTPFSNPLEAPSIDAIRRTHMLESAKNWAKEKGRRNRVWGGVMETFSPRVLLGRTADTVRNIVAEAKGSIQENHEIALHVATAVNEFVDAASTPEEKSRRMRLVHDYFVPLDESVDEALHGHFATVKEYRKQLEFYKRQVANKKAAYEDAGPETQRGIKPGLDKAEAAVESYKENLIRLDRQLAEKQAERLQKITEMEKAKLAELEQYMIDNGTTPVQAEAFVTRLSRVKNIVEENHEKVFKGSKVIGNEEAYHLNKRNYLHKNYLKFYLAQSRPPVFGWKKHRKDQPQRWKSVVGELDKVNLGAVLYDTLHRINAEIANQEMISKLLNENAALQEGGAEGYVLPQIVTQDENGNKVSMSVISLVEAINETKDGIDYIKQQQIDVDTAPMEEYLKQLISDLDTQGQVFVRRLPEFRKKIANGEQIKEEDWARVPTGPWVRMPTNPVYAGIAGMVVHKSIYNTLVDKYTHNSVENPVGPIMQFSDNLNRIFKMMKVPLNPPTAIRNILSNILLSWLVGRVPLWSLPSQAAQAGKLMSAWGKIHKDGYRMHHIAENPELQKQYGLSDVGVATLMNAASHGLLSGNFTDVEVRRAGDTLAALMETQDASKVFFDGTQIPDGAAVSKKVGAMMKRGYNKANKSLGKVSSKVYGHTETLGKLAIMHYHHQRRADGKVHPGQFTDDHIYTMAIRALFDYSDVPQWMKSIRTHGALVVGAPFITFTYKFAASLVESMSAVEVGVDGKPHAVGAQWWAVNGGLLIGLIYLLRSMSDDLEDDWRKRPHWLAEREPKWAPPTSLNISRDKHGRAVTLDFGYIAPWTGLVQILNHASKAEIKDMITAIGVAGGPVPDMVNAFMSNRDDFTGREIVDFSATPSEVTADVSAYFYNLMAPSIISTRGPAAQIWREATGGLTPFSSYNTDSRGQPLRTIQQNAWKMVGMNMHPYDKGRQTALNIKHYGKPARDTAASMRKYMSNQSIPTEQKKRGLDSYIKMMQERREEQRRKTEQMLSK